MKPISDAICLSITDLSNASLDTGLLLLEGELLGLVLLGDLLPLLLGLLGSIALVLLEGVLTDSLVGFDVEVLETIGLNVIVNVLLELRLVALLVVISQSLHVLSDVTADNVLAESLGIELLRLDIETGESVLGVRNEDATVGGTLHGTEDTGTSGGTGKTDIEEGLEGAALAIVGLGSLSQGVLAISLLNTGEVAVNSELLEGTAGDQQTGSIGSSPVGQAVLDAVGAELVGVGSDEDLVTGDLRADDLPVFFKSLVSTSSHFLPDCPTTGYGRWIDLNTYMMMSRLVKRTTRRYLGALYLFLAWVMRRLRA